MASPYLQRARFEAVSWLSRYPSTYYGFSRIFGTEENEHPLDPRYVTDSTDIVIEGFPRSANTFSTMAFAMSQTRPVSVAHHRHAAAQIVAGVRRGLPTILLIRDPVDAVASLMIRYPVFPARQAFRRYILFHRSVLPLREKLVVSDFSRTTGDFGSTVAEVNERFGTDFGVFPHDEASVAECFRRIEERNRRRFGAGDVDEKSVARPSESRDELKRKVRDALADPALARCTGRARALYQQLTDA